MNLMKIFNKNFFKENIKKSKGLLAFFFGVVPLINIIVLVVVLSENDTSILFDFNTISMVTYLGLYILPIVLAISLFGFVFKQKSVDFVMSKPISRKSIYITNVVGAILLMLLFMLINTGIFALFGLLFNRIVIPGALLFDYFLFWFISYIFMFIVTTLAVTLAGNFISSIVIVMIIICLFPFIELTNTSFVEARSNNYYECNNEACIPNIYGGNKTREKNKQYELGFSRVPNGNYTAPALIVKGMEETIYNSVSLIKMTILSVAYGGLGYLIFKKRKMENNETSFKSEGMHYLVKAITLLPVSFICFYIIRYTDFIGILVTGVGILIYSIVYDFITRKEIYKLIKSSILSWAFCFIMVLGYFCYLNYNEHKVTVLKDIKAITIENEDLTINDKTLVQEIIKDAIEGEYDIKGRSYYYLYFKVDNKSYYLSEYLSKNIINKIDEYKNQEAKKLAKNFNYNGIDSFGDIPVTKNLKNIVKNAMINYKGNDTVYYLEAADYRNHNYEKIRVPINASKQLTDYVMNYKNNKAISFLEKNINRDSDVYVNSSDNDYFITENHNIFEYVISKNINNFIDYLKTQNKVVGKNTLYVGWYSGVKYENILILDSAAFEKEYKKYKENLKNDSKYLDLINRIEYTPNTTDEDRELYEY